MKLWQSRGKTKRTSRSSNSGGGGHLDRHTSTERTSTSGVLATDHADTGLSSNSTSASLVSRDGGSEREILHLLVVVAATGIAVHVLGDLDRGPVGTRAGCVDHAGVGARTVTVDLVKSHHELAARRDLGKSVAAHGHHCGGAGLDVVVACTESLTAGGGGITLEAGGILLERLASRAVTGSSRVNCWMSDRVLQREAVRKGWLSQDWEWEEGRDLDVPPMAEP